MNGLRRAFLVLYSLLVIGAAGGLIALAWNQDRKLDINIGSFNLQAFIVSDDTAKWVLTIVLGAVALIGFLTLLLAVARTGQRGSAKGTLRMRQSDGGTVEVTAGAIENLLREELEQLPDVQSVTPRVRVGSGGAVETAIDAAIEPTASIAVVTNELGQGVANVLRDQVGVTNVRRPSIRITYDEVNARSGARRAAVANHNDTGYTNSRPAGMPQPTSEFNPPVPQQPARAPEPLREEDTHPNE